MVGLLTNYCGLTAKRYNTRREFFGFIVSLVAAQKYLAEPYPTATHHPEMTADETCIELVKAKTPTGFLFGYRLGFSLNPMSRSF